MVACSSLAAARRPKFLPPFKSRPEMGGFFIALVAALWHFSPPVRRVRLSVRTRPSQGREAGSIPARATISFCPFRAGKAHSPRKPPFGLLPITRLQRQLRRSISPAGIAAFIGEFSVNLDAPRSEPSPCRFRRPGILARPVGDSSRRPQRSTPPGRAGTRGLQGLRREPLPRFSWMIWSGLGL